MSEKEIMGRAILAFNEREEQPIDLHLASDITELVDKIQSLTRANDNIYYDAGSKINQHIRNIQNECIDIAIAIEDMQKIECDHSEKHRTECHDDYDCRCFDPEG